MQHLKPSRIRMGAVALGISALLLSAFPLIRPFFPLDPTSPGETLAAASPAITSTSWVVAHLLCTLAFIMLLYGLLVLYAHLADGHAEPRALRGFVLSVAGIALILPMLGVETYVLPIIGKLYLAGETGIAPAVRWLYNGPAMIPFLLGLLLLACGAVFFAMTMWQHKGSPRGAGILFAIGLTLWFPPFPRIIRIVDGLLIGIGGIWLAWSLWRESERAQHL